MQPADALESDSVEIKGWCNDERQLIEKVVDAASCLANAHGGLVLIGVGDRANALRFSACPYPQLAVPWLVARVQDNTYPPLGCTARDLTGLLAEARGVGGANVFALLLERKRCLSGHVTAKGIARVRMGKECRPLFATEDDRTGVIVPDACVDNLSLGSIQWAMGQHGRHFPAADTEPR